MFSEMKTVELNKIPIGASISINNHELRDMMHNYPGIQLQDVLVRKLEDSVIVTMRAFIYGQDNQTVSTVESPATLWDEFKLDHFPDWLLRRFPPKYKHYEFDIQIFYPELDIKLPDNMFTARFYDRREYVK